MTRSGDVDKWDGKRAEDTDRDMDILEVLLLVDDLDAMFVAARRQLFADGREVAVHGCDGRVSEAGRWKREAVEKREKGSFSSSGQA